jgi:glycosyltransferase involved in cell wall biosynthesis
VVNATSGGMIPAIAPGQSSERTMVGESPQIQFLIITPTYHRESLLGRFLKQVRAQTYKHWRLLVVHDGANPATEALVGRFRALDPRIEYLHTANRGNDFGVTPRLEALRHAAGTNPADYVVLWDDDDYFVRTALETIAKNLEAEEYPAVLLSPNHYRNRVIPPPGVEVDDLLTGQVTTGNFAVRPRLALEAYEQIIAMKDGASNRAMYVQDYLLFDQLRKLDPPPSMRIAPDAVIGMHDGLRPQVYLRNRLGIPPLGLLNRERISKLMFWKAGSR